MPGFFYSSFHNLHQQKLKFLGENGGTSLQILQLFTLAISQMFLGLLLYFVKMMNFYFFQYEMQTGTGTANLKNQDSILNVTSDVLHFIGDSSVPDTIDKNCLEGAKFLERSCLKLVTNYYTTVLTKLKTGVRSATFILKLQNHVLGTR